MRNLLFCFLFATAQLFAQSPTDTSASKISTTSSPLPWFSIIVAIFVIVVLFSGILVQKRWRDNLNH